MAIKPNPPLPLLLLLLSFLLLSTTLAFSSQRETPEQRLQQCRQRCEQSQQQRQCKLECHKRYQQEKQQQEQEQEQDREDPQEKLKECKQRCYQRHQGWEKQQQCTQECEERYRRGGSNPYEKEEENPYVFDRQSFKHWFRTEHGHVRVLKRFDEKSSLLAGIANYRVAILEAEPRAFVLPNHVDADCVCYVTTGRGTVSIIWREQQHSFEINQGDIFATPAGAIIYMVNTDNKERLVIAKLLQPVSIPGRFENFFGTGGQNPESFYRAFSDEVLQATFNSPRERLERIFGKQSKGAIIQASEEQVRALSRHQGGGIWPFGGGGSESRGTFNLLRKRPTLSNRHGRLHEADANDYEWLRQLDIKVSFANITSGSMTAPFYNSRSTKISLVTAGSGEIEIICPHLSRQSQRKGKGQREEEEQQEGGQRGQSYQNVRAHVSPGMAIVVPAGHPNVHIASSSSSGGGGGRAENLQVVCFEICAEKNERVFVGGRSNALKLLPREAKELAFGSPAREVEEVMDAQKEEGFLAGPEEWRRRRGTGGGSGVDKYNILEVFAGF